MKYVQDGKLDRTMPSGKNVPVSNGNLAITGLKTGLNAG